MNLAERLFKRIGIMDDFFFIRLHTSITYALNNLENETDIKGLKCLLEFSNDLADEILNDFESKLEIIKP